ncbi:MAG: hypothetical protein IJA91_00285 [Clostridia bacterium]|nr:hypothetical protein [Clostridia bacterium]
MSASSTERTRLSTWIRGHLTADLVILIVTSCLNILWALIWTPLAFSSAFAFAVSLYAISNISGAKFGPMPCMHVLRKAWLRSHDKMNEYQESCLRYLTAMLPISVVWTFVNFAIAVGRIVYLFIR